MNAKQVINKLNIENNKDAVQHALEKLSEEKQVKPIEDDKFSLNNPSSHSTERKVYTGVVDMTRTGSAYIICDELKDDIHVSAKRINGALHGDKVKISVWTPKGRNKPEGEIMEVVERATSHFLGTLRLTLKYGIVIPDKDNMPIDIFVKPEDAKNAKDGDKVVVKVVEWPSRQNHSPIGKVTSVLGAVGSSDIEMKSILINNGFELDFPEEVLEEMANLNDHYPIEELEQRRDMRDVPTFTIDPDDAKDFDDALSLRYLEDGHYEVGVHIADVSHYVLPGTALDKEAFKRSTSVYLVDRVLPMLPEKISNELCSLRPNEEKLTFSAVFEFDKNDKVIARWFGKTIIYSNRRFTYKEAQEVLDSGEGDFAADLKKLNQVAKN
ncbi:MAG: RNB domain-containing ribonuclease [Saprospiraceae bacterium]|nr:RNB domain-containing ribonuclease [Saprospiraceae bacterium]